MKQFQQTKTKVFLHSGKVYNSKHEYNRTKRTTKLAKGQRVYSLQAFTTEGVFVYHKEIIFYANNEVAAKKKAATKIQYVKYKENYLWFSLYEVDETKKSLGILRVYKRENNYSL